LADVSALVETVIVPVVVVADGLVTPTVVIDTAPELAIAHVPPLLVSVNGIEPLVIVPTVTPQSVTPAPLIVTVGLDGTDRPVAVPKPSLIVSPAANAPADPVENAVFQFETPLTSAGNGVTVTVPTDVDAVIVIDAPGLTALVLSTEVLTLKFVFVIV